MFFRGVLAYLVTMVELVIFFLFDCNYFLCFMRGLVFLVSVVELVIPFLYVWGRLMLMVFVVLVVLVLILTCKFQKLSLDMSCQWLGKMFEGDFADMHN